MNTFRVIREVPADGVQVEAVSILKFLIFRLIDLNVTVLCFDQQIASGASVAFQSFFMDAVTLLDCRDHVYSLCRCCDRSRRSSADGCSLFRYLFQFYVGDYRVCRRPRPDLLRSGVFRKTSFLQNQFHIGYCKRADCLHNRYAMVEADRTILIFQ